VLDTRVEVKTLLGGTSEVATTDDVPKGAIVIGELPTVSCVESEGAPCRELADISLAVDMERAREAANVVEISKRAVVVGELPKGASEDNGISDLDEVIA